MLKKSLYFTLLVGVLVACNNTKTITLPEQTIVINDPNKIPVRPTYNASNTKDFDLIHTKLDVRFNWEKAHMYGKAELTLVPYF